MIGPKCELLPCGLRYHLKPTQQPGLFSAAVAVRVAIVCVLHFFPLLIYHPLP